MPFQTNNVAWVYLNNTYLTSESCNSKLLLYEEAQQHSDMTATIDLQPDL